MRTNFTPGYSLFCGAGVILWIVVILRILDDERTGEQKNVRIIGWIAITLLLWELLLLGFSQTDVLIYISRVFSRLFLAISLFQQYLIARRTPFRDGTVYLFGSGLEVFLVVTSLAPIFIVTGV